MSSAVFWCFVGCVQDTYEPTPETMVPAIAERTGQVRLAD
eukprot:COSAG06_NODE_34481_length_474_cov_0.536000_2_plen_39_part_01